MSPTPIKVFIVDDENSIRTAYSRLVRSARMEPRAFASVEEFMAEELDDANACLVCDIALTGISGLELPGLLRASGRQLPVIFVTAHDTPETRRFVREAGAAGYFRKPVDDQALIDAIVWALGRR